MSIHVPSFSNDFSRISQIFSSIFERFRTLFPQFRTLFAQFRAFSERFSRIFEHFQNAFRAFSRISKRFLCIFERFSMWTEKVLNIKVQLQKLKKLERHEYRFFLTQKNPFLYRERLCPLRKIAFAVAET